MNWGGEVSGRRGERGTEGDKPGRKPGGGWKMSFRVWTRDSPVWMTEESVERGMVGG